MFKKCLFIFFIILLTSCENNNWQHEIQNQVNIYNKTVEEEDSYLIEANQASNIWLKKYAERYGLRKIVTAHVSPKLMDFERHIFLKDQQIIYTHYIGIAPRINGSSEQDFLIFNKQSFWRDTGNGQIFKQQVVSDVFKNRDEVMKVLEKTDIVVEDVSSKEYLEIQEYYDEVTALKPKK
ncbi:hypothetical protein [Flagellimonas sp. 2504JD4-2]